MGVQTRGVERDGGDWWPVWNDDPDEEDDGPMELRHERPAPGGWRSRFAARARGSLLAMVAATLGLMQE